MPCHQISINSGSVIVILLFTCTMFPCFGKNDAKELKIKQGHPILFITPELVEKIKQKNLNAFKTKVKSYQKNTDNPDDISKIRAETDKYMTNDHNSEYRKFSMYYGINAYINNDPLSKEYGRQFILSILDRPVNDGPNDGKPRGRLLALGILYDWIYYYLSEPIRKQVRDRIMDYIEYLESRWKYHSKPHFTGAHCRLANWSALAGLFAIRHDIEKDSDSEQSRYFRYLQRIVDNWRYGYNPVESWMNMDGGHHMGWAYGDSYAAMYPYLLWELATNEKSWFSKWQEKYIYFIIYGFRGNNVTEKWPYSGDIFNTKYSVQRRLNILTCSYIYNNEHAKWFYNIFGNQSNIYWDVLYNHFLGSAGRVPNDLPLSRHFRNSAFVVIRDSWDLNNNTLLVFKSSSFYSLTHHHKDQNSFTIFYKSPLVIDAGEYSYGSDQYWNFYSRSIAHNTMLIHDPKEVFKHPWKSETLSNDGGQYFFNESYPNLEQIQKEEGSNHIGGIQNYEHHTDYTFTMGDATKAYKSSKLSKFLRSIVLLRNYSYNHPVVIVYDKVVSTNPECMKTYLLHSEQEPAIKDKTVIIRGKSGGALFQETILPEKVNIRSVNQSGWRLEISPAVPVKKDYFLNILSVTDGVEKYKKTQAQYISSENSQFEGVSIIDSDNNSENRILVLFNKDTHTIDDKIVTEFQDFKKILIVGLKPNAEYKTNYIKSDTKINLRIKKTGDTRGSNKASDQGTIYLDLSSPGGGPINSKNNYQKLNEKKDFKIKQKGKYLSYYSSEPSDIKIDLYDLRGKMVMQLFKGKIFRGSHSIPLKIHKVGKKIISDGLYFGFIRIDRKLLIKNFLFK